MSSTWVVIATPYHVPYQIPFVFEYREEALVMLSRRINHYLATNCFLRSKDFDVLNEALCSISYGFFQPFVIDHVKWDLRQMCQ